METSAIEADADALRAGQPLPDIPHEQAFGQPKGLWVLAGTELWDRISFHGMVAMLTLYMAGELLLPGRVENVVGFAAYRSWLEGITGPLSVQALATQTFGLYFSGITFMPLFGGVVGDRLIGRRAAVKILHRRLAAVPTQAEVDDVAAEWLDRYGPLPAPAEALVRVARLRAECVRTGIREVTVARNVIRMAPVELKLSAQIRLKRIAPKAVLKEELRQLVVPVMANADPVTAVLTLVDQLLPPE